MKRIKKEIEYIKIDKFDKTFFNNLSESDLNINYKYEEFNFIFKFSITKDKYNNFCLDYKSKISPNDSKIYQLDNKLTDISLKKAIDRFLNKSYIKIKERITEKKAFFNK